MLRDGSSGGVTAIEPEPTEPELPEPEMSRPEVSEPEVSEPEVSEPKVSEPEISGPEPTVLDREPAAPHPIGGFDALLDDADASADEVDTGEELTVASIFDFSDRVRPQRPRTSVLGWLSLAFSFLAPPLGLVLSIIARVWAHHRHGWRTWPVTLATVVAVLLTAAIVVAGFLVGIRSTQTAGVDAIVADSAAFCAALDETPGVLDVAGYGWPSEVGTVDESIAAMTAYRDRWTELAELAPSAIASGAGSIADVASALVDNAESTRSVDRQRNLDAISAVTNTSGIPAYTAVYCR